MLTFDMLTNGIQGDILSNDPPLKEIEVFGIDWEGLQDKQLLASIYDRNNVQTEGFDSWVGQVSPPPHLNEVHLDAPPQGSFTAREVETVDNAVAHYSGQGDDNSIIGAWRAGLVAAQMMRPNFF